MAAQSQAMQAGASFDLLTESDLTNLSKLASYDALIFPSFTDVHASDVVAITNTLVQATRQFGVGLITAGDFMTNDEDWCSAAGRFLRPDEAFFDATRVIGGTATYGQLQRRKPDSFHDHELRRPDPQLYGGRLDRIHSVSGNGQTIATETVGRPDYAAALATQTGGRNVLFSTAGVMADSNLLWQAIDYVAKDPGVSISLEMTRFNGMVASRTDMDQAMQTIDVKSRRRPSGHL